MNSGLDIDRDDNVLAARAARPHALTNAAGGPNLTGYPHVRAASMMMPMRNLLVLALLLVAACADSPTAPQPGVYVLASVNGQPLPGPFPNPTAPLSVFEVTLGLLTLNPDGTVVQELSMRCKPNGSATQCDVPANALVRQTGTYSAADGIVVLDGRSYQANFSAARISITIAIPPSQGFFPRFDLDWLPNSTTNQ